MARISEGKNGHTKSEANTKVLALNEVFIQYSDAFFSFATLYNKAIIGRECFESQYD